MEAFETKIHRQSAWQIQRSVVFGIFIRELENRFGRYALGYLWAPLEPLVYVIVLSLVRGRFAAGDIGGISPVVFFASGVLGYIFFRQIPITSLSCVESNQGLFNYQRVKPADIFVARFILESLIILFVAVLLFPLLLGVGQDFTINDPLRLFAVLATFLVFVAGLGLTCTALGPLWIEAKKVLPLLIRPMFFISGIFFPLVSVPVALRSYLTWNPVLHALELTRDAAFVGYNLAPEVSFSFLFWCAVISFAFGLSVYRLLRIKIVTSGTIR
ncbi:MAG: ABC transporter permease [Opitutales bacterium]|nr:ABC transporter permease [Opitutales bacterium]